MNDSGTETTLANRRMHWGIFIFPVLIVSALLVVALAGGVMLHFLNRMIGQLDPATPRPLGGLFFLLLFLPELFVGLPLLLVVWFAYLKSSITLTDRRLMYRTGLLARVTGELPLKNVEAIILAEPLLGRVFGYGTVMVTSVGGLRFPLRFIGAPAEFHAAVQKAVRTAKSPEPTGIAATVPATMDDSRYMPKR